MKSVCHINSGLVRLVRSRCGSDDGKEDFCSLADFARTLFLGGYFLELRLSIERALVLLERQQDVLGG